MVLGRALADELPLLSHGLRQGQVLVDEFPAVVGYGLRPASFPHVKHGARGASASSFYVDCRLYRVSDDAAERAARELGKPEPTPPGGKKGGGLAAVSALKDVAGEVAAATGKTVPGGLDAEPPSFLPEPDFHKQCAELQGVFDDRIMSATASDAKDLMAESPDYVSHFTGSEYPDGFFVYNTRAKNWFQCVILGEKGRAYLNCTPYASDEDAGSCGGLLDGSKCDYDRWNFTTACLAKSQSKLSGLGPAAGMLSLGNNKCIYIGHFGEAQPLDIIGKPANYGVYFMACPPALLGAAFFSPTGHRTRKSHSDFLSGPSCSDRNSTDAHLIGG